MTTEDDYTQKGICSQTSLEKKSKKGKWVKWRWREWWARDTHYFYENSVWYIIGNRRKKIAISTSYQILRVYIIISYPSLMHLITD